MVTLATERHGSFSGWSTSVSQGGCFVNTKIAAPVGEVVQVCCSSPARRSASSARVVWSQLPVPAWTSRHGVEFLDADETTRARLGRIVSQLSKDLSTAPA